ncbi:hemicentin-1-like [Dermatophagoides farinae]|uniref:Hemicentin-1-like n=1 Tax=Dermatophagoides farinae TaxID=6954 RepID=A0A9D4NXH7_DERFA|nr:hemicentin-1-like [Dermatophagoides farinae]
MGIIDQYQSHTKEWVTLPDWMAIKRKRYTLHQTDEPEFVGMIPNLTVSVGRDAKFPCIVNNLDTYRVGWIRNEDKSILTIQHQVVTRNSRISLTQSEHKIWTLHIKNVQESDRGGYMCQINTMPMKSQIGYLDVTVPPDFINSETSSDVIVRENQNLTLRCKARGHPEPKLTWRREDNKPIEYGNWQLNKESGFEYPNTTEGEVIHIEKVSRLHMGAYLCIAQNGVPPSVSRRIVLQVNFPPMIWVPNQLLGATINDQVTLRCDTEAFPLSLNYWTKEDRSSSSSSSSSSSTKGDEPDHGEIMIVNSDRYRIANQEQSYKVHMKLVIKHITIDDFGIYRCHTKNSLGSTQGSIRIYEIHRTPSLSSSSSSTSSDSTIRPITISRKKEPSTARILGLNDSSNDPMNEEYYSSRTIGLSSSFGYLVPNFISVHDDYQITGSQLNVYTLGTIV